MGDTWGETLRLSSTFVLRAHAHTSRFFLSLFFFCRRRGFRAAGAPVDPRRRQVGRRRRGRGCEGEFCVCEVDEFLAIWRRGYVRCVITCIYIGDLLWSLQECWEDEEEEKKDEEKNEEKKEVKAPAPATKSKSKKLAEKLAEKEVKSLNGSIHRTVFGGWRLWRFIWLWRFQEASLVATDLDLLDGVGLSKEEILRRRKLQEETDLKVALETLGT